MELSLPDVCTQCPFVAEGKVVPLEIEARALATVLDNLDALVYVSDLESHDMLYINAYGRQRWGEIRGRKCWEMIQTDQSGPCTFCTNHLLLKADGSPAPVHVWEFQNTVNQRWYQCRDQAIVWQGGRLVRLEIATDITERKEIEISLENARKHAESLAHRDELTGLPNRRAFFSLGSHLLQHAQRHQESVHVVMLDLDYFKSINDRYGHAVGDQVLATIGGALGRQVRHGEVLARLGGEEFAVLMAGADQAQVERLVQRLRRTLASTSVSTQEGEITCTASIGIAGKEAPGSLEALLSAADHAMYQAKQRGRDGLVWSLQI